VEWREIGVRGRQWNLLKRSRKRCFADAFRVYEDVCFCDGEEFDGSSSNLWESYAHPNFLGK
jgi:hypothetical protein